MHFEKLQIINEYERLMDSEVVKAVTAVQKQIRRDFSRFWHVGNPTLEIVDGPHKLNHKLPWVVILDNTDHAGALGYHDMTKEHMPVGKVFAGSDQRYGMNWNVTFSHEILELLADPQINRVVEGPNHHMYAVEVCDACEDDSYAYDIDGTKVSDFVTPAWFGMDKSTTYDFQKHIHKPFELLRGGYIGVFKDGHWTQVTDQKNFTIKARPPVGSRRERRMAGVEQWLVSTR